MFVCLFVCLQNKRVYINRTTFVLNCLSLFFFFCVCGVVYWVFLGGDFFLGLCCFVVFVLFGCCYFGFCWGGGDFCLFVCLFVVRCVCVCVCVCVCDTRDANWDNPNSTQQVSILNRLFIIRLLCYWIYAQQYSS